MSDDHTTAVVERYLVALDGETPADPIVRELLLRAYGTLIFEVAPVEVKGQFDLLFFFKVLERIRVSRTMLLCNLYDLLIVFLDTLLQLCAGKSLHVDAFIAHALNAPPIRSIYEGIACPEPMTSRLFVVSGALW